MRMPVGLQKLVFLVIHLKVYLTLSISLGNTCYMSATVQALRAIPELQTALDP